MVSIFSRNPSDGTRTLGMVHGGIWAGESWETFEVPHKSHFTQPRERKAGSLYSATVAGGRSLAHQEPGWCEVVPYSRSHVHSTRATLRRDRGLVFAPGPVREGGGPHAPKHGDEVCRECDALERRDGCRGEETETEEK